VNLIYIRFATLSNCWDTLRAKTTKDIWEIYIWPR